MSNIIDYGPWYENVGPTYKDVVLDVYNSTSKIINDNEIRKKIVIEVIPKEVDFGSWRGYCTFLKQTYVEQVIKKWE